MEIEAKYIVPDKRAANEQRALDRIDSFTLGAATRYVVRDTYFDTRANDLLNTRHVLRLRQRSDGRAFLTFKAPVQKTGAIHRRPETEVAVTFARSPRVLQVNALPVHIRKLVVPLAHKAVLYPMFSISQRRLVRNVRAGRKTIGEWSLDHVRFRSGARTHEFYELEIELKKTGTVQELRRITAWLEREFDLRPQTESKFKRALDFMRSSV